MMAGFDHHSVCARCRDKKKGSDPCTKTPPEDCQHCDALTPDQRAQIATPSYKLKKEKKDAKSTPVKDSDNPTLVDPALVSVLGVVDNQSTPGASASSEPVEKKKKTEPKHSSKSTKSEKSVKQSSNRPATTSSESKPSSSSTDTKLVDMDKKWAERFNRLEALFLAKTVDPPRDPVFSTVKVTPAHAPPANVVRTNPFIKPQAQTSQPTLLEIQPPTLPSTRRTLRLHLLNQILRLQLLLRDTYLLPSTSPARNPLLVILTPTHPQINLHWIFYQKKENCRTNWRPTSLIRNSLCQKSSPTRRRCGELDPTWGGITYQTLTQGLPRWRTIPLQAPNHMRLAKSLSTYPLTSGCAGRWPS